MIIIIQRLLASTRTAISNTSCDHKAGLTRSEKQTDANYGTIIASSNMVISQVIACRVTHKKIFRRLFSLACSVEKR